MFDLYRAEDLIEQTEILLKLNEKTMNLQDIFIPYEESLELKELGFDKECLSIYTHNNDFYKKGTFFLHHPHPFTIEELTPEIQDVRENSVYILAPTWEQAFKFFRDKKLYHCEVCYNEYYKWYQGTITDLRNSKIISDTVADKSNTYEEARLECLRKLIEICKQN